MQVESILTPASPATVAGAMAYAYARATGNAPPARSSWLFPMAQSALETARWSAMWNWNPGNVTHYPGDAFDWFVIGHNALGEASKLQFRSYGSLGAGAEDMMRVLLRDGALPSADAGDVAGYTAALKAHDYAGGDPSVYPAYQKGIADLVAQYVSIDPAPYSPPATPWRAPPFGGAAIARRGRAGAVVALAGMGAVAAILSRRRGRR